jgi:ABC-type multidrug transport system ATPase subunit
MTPLLAAECVSKSYGARRILSSATLRAMVGELRVLFGRNGIGKSTLLKIAAGRIAPDGGSVQFAGRAYLAAHHAELATHGLFYLPDHDFLSRAYTVRRQLSMIQQQFSGGNIVDAAERIGIGAHLDKRPGQLSGGELRRAELAAVLVRQPRCFLADEPYRGISPKDAEDVTSVLQELARAGTAVLITGHEIPTLLAAADHISWCTSGTTYELGPPKIAVQHEAFRKEYLGSGWATRAATPAQ